MSPESTAYPPEPWDLAGQGWITLWRVPLDALPQLPFSARALHLRGQALVATAFVAYSEAGLMAYDELLAAVVVRHGRRVGLSITDIWVDSPSSRAGGRELWGIPKDLADFDRSDDGRLAARREDAPIAAATFRPRGVPAVPLPIPLPGWVVQTLQARTVDSRIRAGGRVRPATATWEPAPGGPLAWLSSGRPVTSVIAEDFSMRFGSG
ncbi:acetoacetate decarboxylase family protein [Nocardioides ferulae]|uniref:acetoacetate decarboxylase family protein n=1 Tax=Nocardioides ferulae TaxID=2340821 RepID=UPI000EB51E58|nr:acetoacetate decarboxylase family protein [Nocardioides ferulae]